MSFIFDNYSKEYVLNYVSTSKFVTVGPTLSKLKNLICNLDERTGIPIEQPPPNYNNIPSVVDPNENKSYSLPPPLPSSPPPSLQGGGKKRKSTSTKKSTKKVKQKKYKHKDHYHLSLETKRKCKR